MPRGKIAKAARKAAKKTEANRPKSPDPPQHRLLGEWADNDNSELTHFLVCMYVAGTAAYENVFIFTCRRSDWKEGISNPVEVKRVKTSLELRQIMNCSRVKMDEDQRQNVMYLTTCIEGGEHLDLIARKVSEEQEKALEVEANNPDAKKVTTKSKKSTKEPSFSTIEAFLGPESDVPEGFKNYLRQKLVEYDQMSAEERKLQLRALVLAHVKSREDEDGIPVTQEEIERMGNEISFQSFINRTKLILDQVPKDKKDSVTRVMAKDEAKARRVERIINMKEKKFRNPDLQVPRKQLDATIANYLTQKLTQLYEESLKK